MATVATPREQRIVLHDVSWETYERLLADHVDRSVPHFTYDRGELEILSPSQTHEEDNRALALLVEIVAMELGVDVVNVGSMTFKRRDLEQGFEPDTSFYIQNEERVQGQQQIDLAFDPPSDLIIEIEVTQSAIPKLPLYANVGVPEVWRIGGGRITILFLDGENYRESLMSAAMPSLTSKILTEFLIARHSLKRTAWLRQIRDWAQPRVSS